MGVLSRPPPRRCGGAGRRAQLLQQRAARRVPLLLALSALIVTATAASAQQQQQPKQAPPPKELHIAHVNDVHNRIEETSPAGSYCDAKQRAKGVCVGGWARIGAAVGTARRQAAREGAGFLFLDAGDEFDGSLWDVVYKGLATADVQNAVMPDAMTLGNHEFSFPAKDLRAYLDRIKFPMLGACNVNTTGQPLIDGKIRRWVVKDLGGGVKVGILGWLTQETAFSAANADGVAFAPVVPAVQRCVADLKRAHPDLGLIIGLSHDGYERDLKTAAAVPDLDLIIGGHSHTFLAPPGAEVGPVFDTTRNATRADCLGKRACDAAMGPYPTYVSTKLCAPLPAASTTSSAAAAGAAAATAASSAAAAPRQKCADKRIPVFQAYYGSKYLGHIKINLTTKAVKSARPVLLGGRASASPWPEDPRVAAVVRGLAGPVAALEEKPSGTINVTFVGGNPGRARETNFGDWAADLLVAEAASMPAFEKAHGRVGVGLVNAGAIRADLEPPAVSYGAVLSAVPFLNTVAVKALTGAQLKETLAFALSGIEEGEGRFLQVAGLRVWHRGPKLLDLRLLLPDGRTAGLSNATRYNVATLDYLAGGGDGFEALEAAPALVSNGNRVDELMFKAFAQSGATPLVPPDPAQQRRIVDCAAAYVDCANAALYGPCCGKAVPEDSQDAAAAKAFETKSPTDGANRRRLRASPLRRRLAAGGVAPGDLLL